MAIVIGVIVAVLSTLIINKLNLSSIGSSFSTVATPAAPVPASTGSPLSSSAATFAVQGSTNLASNVQTLASTGTKAATSIASSAGAASTFATAIPVVGAVIGAVAQVLLAQHTARLKGAISENQLIPQSVQAFDADIADLVTAYNGAQVPVNSDGTSPTCATAVIQMDMALFTFMKGNATGPGRAWTNNNAGSTPINSTQGPSCNSSCTAECCVFYNDMNNILAVLYQFFTTGAKTTTVLSSPIASGMQFTVPEVVQPPPQYGTFSRAKYTITLTIPTTTVTA
jgi:hypothetical protein